MTIENLIRVAPPPAEPTDIFGGPWAPVEAELGLVLPGDYKDFVRLYGRGYFLEFLGVDVPRAHNSNVRLERNVPQISGVLRQAWDIPHPIWPETGGLMRFGGTDNGDHLLWVTRGRPEEWVVAVLAEDSSGEFEVFDCDMTDFLAGLATGAIRPAGLPDDLFTCERKFIADPAPAEQIVRVTWRLGSFGGGSSSSRLR